MTTEYEIVPSRDDAISKGDTTLDPALHTDLEVAGQPCLPASDLQPTGVEQADSVKTQKDVEFYAAVVNGWVATRMEYDRTLVSLSAGGIALFVTLLTTLGVQSWWEAGFFLLGSVGFIGSIATALEIFVRNADFLEALMKGHTEGDPELEKLDKRIVRFFILGAVGALIAGGSAAVSRYHFEHDSLHQRGTMAAPDAPNQTKDKSSDNAGASTPTSSNAGSKTLHESFNGLQNLAPSKVQKGSVNGVQALKPPDSTALPAESPTPSGSDTAPDTKPAEQ